MTDQVQIPPGLITVTTHGLLRAEFGASIVQLQARVSELGLANSVAIEFISGHLVDKARNDAALRVLQGGAQWLWFLDADMTFDPRILDRLLTTAFGTHAHADIVGGYCVLSGDPFLPTIDTGTGTWETTPPNIGVIPVIRTGGACLLIKRRAFERLAYPWFGIRNALRPIDAISEVDGFARQLYDGSNPLTKLPEWQKLYDIAMQRAAEQRARDPHGLDAARGGTVGEDSNFCDYARAHGLQIVVDTHAICGHVKTQVLGPEDHLKAMQRRDTMARQAAGVLA